MTYAAHKGKAHTANSGSGLPGSGKRFRQPAYNPGSLLSQYLAARDRLSETLSLLERALDLLELLDAGVLDIDQARELVAELRRDVARCRP